MGLRFVQEFGFIRVRMKREVPVSLFRANMKQSAIVFVDFPQMCCAPLQSYLKWNSSELGVFLEEACHVYTWQGCQTSLIPAVIQQAGPWGLVGTGYSEHDRMSNCQTWQWSWLQQHRCGSRILFTGAKTHSWGIQSQEFWPESQILPNRSTLFCNFRPCVLLRTFLMSTIAPP